CGVVHHRILFPRLPLRSCLDTATTEIYTLSLHDALPIYGRFFAKLNYFIFAMSLLVLADGFLGMLVGWANVGLASYQHPEKTVRSEEHTSELQSREKLVCRLLLEKKKFDRTELIRITTAI